MTIKNMVERVHRVLFSDFRSILSWFRLSCGIEIKGDNKWITLIQNASKTG